MSIPRTSGHRREMHLKRDESRGYFGGNCHFFCHGRVAGKTERGLISAMKNLESKVYGGGFLIVAGLVAYYLYRQTAGASSIEQAIAQASGGLIGPIQRGTGGGPLSPIRDLRALHACPPGQLMRYDWAGNMIGCDAKGLPPGYKGTWGATCNWAAKLLGFCF